MLFPRVGEAKLLLAHQIWTAAFFFMHTILLEHSHAHSFTYCLWLLLGYNDRVD